MSPTPLDRPADWLTVREALDRILAAIQPLPTERVPLLESLGRVLAEPIVSPIDQPPWTNSGMDGFACRAEDIRGATPEHPRLLRIVEEVPAGAFPTRAIGPREGVRLMTGAPVPEGADSVVRLEHTHPVSGTNVVVERDVDAGRNLRERGEDLRAGSTALEAGTVIRPAEIGVLATVGRAEVLVHRRARVAILSNGDELVDLDDFEQVLAGKRIVNSNSYGLAAAVLSAGAAPVLLGIARDKRESLREHLERARGADALLTTAGASVGDLDLMKDVLEELGYRLSFWRVQVQPGSPFSFGLLGDVPVFGLAGNPVSALVTFEVLVRPALRRLHGQPDVFPSLIRVRTAERIESRAGLMRFLRA
ncbi:MAG TPA: gephyrin-like molybdotransferase Glp, partial [Longimicrobiales bacterium]